MPKIGMTEQFDLTTRSAFSKVDCEISIRIDGKELPSNEVVGKALDKAIETVQAAITESYQKVPERTPLPTVVPPAPPAFLAQPDKPKL